MKSVLEFIIYSLFLLTIGVNVVISDEKPSELEKVFRRLQKSADQLSLTIFLEVPDAPSYLNFDLLKNAPHKMNLSEELTLIIRDWSPRLLALDPTCPYYFSKYANTSAEKQDLNLLSYLQAIQSNSTLDQPFRSVLPQSYRHALPLLSMYHCSEYVYSTSDPFFHNVELLVGPGKTELPLERTSEQYSQLYCSLSGWPHFILLNQTKQPSTTYTSTQLLSTKNLSDVEFISTTLAPGSCLYVPPDWVVGSRLNNSISLIFTLKKVEEPVMNETHYEPLPCTSTGNTTLDNIQFGITDQFNISEIGLVVYFYQYLNPPVFDKEFSAEKFFDAFRNDKNVSQLIMTWTPELTSLIRDRLFQCVDINKDKLFSVDDYFDIKRTNLKSIQNSILEILEEMRQTVLLQYKELNETVSKMTEQMSSLASDANSQEALEFLLNNLPENVKEQLREKNIDVRQFLDQTSQQNKRPKRPSSKKTQKTRENDATLLFEHDPDDNLLPIVDQNQEEEEIIAEPIHTDL